MEKTRNVLEITILVHSQAERFFANVSLSFSNCNNKGITLALAAIFLSLMQRVKGNLVAVKDLDHSCSLGYKRPITSKS